MLFVYCCGKRIEFMNSILFVCHGNICRSPMAEYIFKKLTNNKYKVESRATSLEEIGNDIYPKAKEVLIKNDIPFGKHQAKRITLDDYNSFDLIVCFDEYNISNLSKLLNTKDKVIKLLDKDIEDPWYTDNFLKVYNEIYEGCIRIIKKYF